MIVPIRSATTKRNNKSIEQIERRHQQQHHEQLPELYSDIERQKRREQMRACELKRLPEHERKTEPVHQAESERDHPPALHIATDDVLERHVDNRHRDQRFDERRKPQSGGHESEGGGDQRDGVRDGKRSDEHYQRAQPPERNHQAEDEKQVVGSVEDMQKAQLDKAQRSLVPSRIEPDETRISVKLERAGGAGGREKLKSGHDPQSEAREPGLDREGR